MVAPVALYPDPLLMQILIASTYPLEVVEADRWRRQHADLKGDALDKALEEKDWDPSVEGLTEFPDLLKRMSENLDWTKDVGDAFLAQKDQVFEAVQRMRRRAQEAGTLQTTKEQTIVKEKETIVIQPPILRWSTSRRIRRPPTGPAMLLRLRPCLAAHGGHPHPRSRACRDEGLWPSHSEMDTVLVMIARGWDNFLARPEGPVNVRFILQPALAAFLALRAGMKDAREGRPAFLWAGLTDSAHRSKLLRAGWKDLRTPFLISAVFDAIYQTIVHQAIYLFELLFTASLLVLVPYVILRGPVNRVTRRFVSGDNHRSQTNKPGQPQT